MSREGIPLALTADQVAQVLEATGDSTGVSVPLLGWMDPAALAEAALLSEDSELSKSVLLGLAMWVELPRGREPETPEGRGARAQPDGLDRPSLRQHPRRRRPAGTGLDHTPIPAHPTLWPSQAPEAQRAERLSMSTVRYQVLVISHGPHSIASIPDLGCEAVGISEAAAVVAGSVRLTVDVLGGFI
jgi:hypothetical protein